MSARYTSHAWAGPEDLAQVHTLLRARSALRSSFVYPSISDFDYWLTNRNNPALPDDIQLWFDGGRLVGYVWPADDELDMIVHPHAADAVPELFAWGHARLEASPPQSGLIKAWCFGDDAQMASLLRAAGYTPTADFVRCNVLDMAAPLPAMPVLPEGYVVRSLQGPQEAAARAAAHMAAFPDWPMDGARHQRIMQIATYRLDHDLVATAPDGSIVATAIVWYDPALRMGLFEPIGCDPQHQRRGLATACIVEGLRRLKRLGAESAAVCGWRDDSEGSRLYAKLGFREVQRRYVWERGTAVTAQPAHS